jgi:Bacterial capsule synthesis protein PGA_cap
VQRSATLLALGDINLSGFAQEQFEQSSSYNALVRQLAAYDGITLANLECALTTSTNLNLTKITLHANPELLHELPRIDVFSLANNHICDAWHEGADDTAQLLTQNGKIHFGYGRDLATARKPALAEKNGIQLGFLGYSCLSTNGHNYATPVGSGVCPIALEYLQTDIPLLKDHVDHVIVALHWGAEDAHYPTPDQIAVAHRAIDLGASAIIGNHPHAIQGIERYKDGFICYSLGNFIFSDLDCEILNQGNRVRMDGRLSKANKESIGVEFAFEKNKVSLRSIKAYKLDDHFLPNEVPIDRLHVNFSRLNASVEAYVNENSGYLEQINGPQIVTRFSNGKSGNYYLLKPISAGPASARLKVVLTRLLPKSLRSIIRSFLGTRN